MWHILLHKKIINYLRVVVEKGTGWKLNHTDIYHMSIKFYCWNLCRLLEVSGSNSRGNHSLEGSWICTCIDISTLNLSRHVLYNILSRLFYCYYKLYPAEPVCSRFQNILIIHLPVLSELNSNFLCVFLF